MGLIQANKQRLISSVEWNKERLQDAKEHFSLNVKMGCGEGVEFWQSRIDYYQDKIYTAFQELDKLV